MAAVEAAQQAVGDADIEAQNDFVNVSEDDVNGVPRNQGTAFGFLREPTTNWRMSKRKGTICFWTAMSILSLCMQ